MNIVVLIQHPSLGRSPQTPPFDPLHPYQHTQDIPVLAHLVDPGPLYRGPAWCMMWKRVKEMALARPH